MDPARTFIESLIPSPELENSQGHKQTSLAGASMSASLIGRLGSSAFWLSPTGISMSLAGSRFSPESALGPSIMGFEDKVERSKWRPCR